MLHGPKNRSEYVWNIWHWSLYKQTYIAIMIISIWFFSMTQEICFNFLIYIAMKKMLRRWNDRFSNYSKAMKSIRFFVNRIFLRGKKSTHGAIKHGLHCCLLLSYVVGFLVVDIYWSSQLVLLKSIWKLSYKVSIKRVFIFPSPYSIFQTWHS